MNADTKNITDANLPLFLREIEENEEGKDRNYQLYLCKDAEMQTKTR